MMKRRALWLGLFALLLSGSAWSKNAPYTHTEVEVLSSADSITHDEKLRLLVKITPKDKWHIYWNNPGDAGIATKVNIHTAYGQAKLLNQSAPKHFLLHNTITQYAYDNAAYWLFEITPSADKPLKNGDEIEVAADVSWLACAEECVAENLTETLKFPVATAIHHPDDWEKELFKAQKNFPARLENGTFALRNNLLHVNLPSQGKTPHNLRLIPEKRGLIIDTETQTFNDDGKLLSVAIPIWDDAAFSDNLDVLLLGESESWKVSLQKDNNALPPLPHKMPNFWLILATAFLGGIILNLMPCIFPVLFLKALNIVNHAHTRQKNYASALCYGGGVMLCFVSVAALLWLLRAAGENIGWGFQLQSPWFVAIMLVLFLLLALMFWGIFDLNISWLNRFGALSGKHTLLNSFVTGFFAVLIASPCSAPFMGAAIGYSITQPAYIYFPIFLVLGLGYALPFALIEMFPKLLSGWLPRPGKWMLTLKKVFAVPMLATCVWLGWILFNQLGITSQTAESEGKLQWQEFSQTNLQQSLQNKRPVLIMFTAKWCLTCLVNEKVALETADFRNYAQKHNIVLLKADWTNKNPQITQSLAQYGRNSVPLYVFYNGQNHNYKILPQLLTPTRVIEETGLDKHNR